jgi:hypothetical protein
MIVTSGGYQVLGYPMQNKTCGRMKTYIRVVPFANPCLELIQAKMNPNTEDNLPICLSAGTGHGFGAGLQ